MLHLVKTINFIIKRTSLLCSLFFAAALALQPISAQAQCAQWDVSGEWYLQQSNGFMYHMELSQSGTAITGRGSYGTVTSGGNFLGVTTGGDPVTVTTNVKGNILGDDFYVLIGTAGVYRGKVGASGRMDGTTYDSSHPSSTATWFSDRQMKCAPLPVQSPPPRPKPVKSSGKMPKSEPAPPPPLKAPWIVAGPAIFPAPFVPTGIGILTWDSGPDHPNAEVWLKTPNGAATVAKQLKGGLQLTVERGRSYEYVLTDAGKILAGVTFVAQ